MFSNTSQSLSESIFSSKSTLSSSTGYEKVDEQSCYNPEAEDGLETTGISDCNQKKRKQVGVGDCLPYGPRMYYESTENVVRMRDIGEKNRVLLVGVIGSFTPDCWNRHLFRVLKKLRYYEEREVDYICCVSTNDPYTQKAWAGYLGCEESILMWADSTTRFTKAMGMDVVIPWLDNRVRSKRYVLLAEDMVVTKMIEAPCDSADMKWQCEHMVEEQSDDEDSEDSWV